MLGAAIDRATTMLRVQGPVRADPHTLPQPDLAVLPRRWPGYPAQHPAFRHAYLIIEVSDSTLLTDSTIKAALYARAKTPEYWIVDLTTDTIVVHRRPRAGAYASIERRFGDDLLQIAALPSIAITAASVFE